MKKFEETIEEWLYDNEGKCVVENLELEAEGKKIIVSADGDYRDLGGQSADMKSWDITITVGDESREFDLRSALLCYGFSVYIHISYLAAAIAETIDEMMEEA